MNVRAYKMGKAPRFIHDEPFNVPRYLWMPLRFRLSRGSTHHGRILTVTILDVWRADIYFAMREVPS